MFDERGIGDVIAQATQQDPQRRARTVGAAVTAMGRTGLGFVKQGLSLVPRFFQHKPTDHRIAPRVSAAQLNDEALGRALDTLSADGGTARDARMAATAAKRLARCPTAAHLDRTSLHVDGRDHGDDPPCEPVVPLTKG